MAVTHLLLALLLAYLIGSLPSAVWAGKLFHGIDVREHGSGNAGATNTIRVLGWSTGIPVLLLDMAKGWFAASLPLYLHIAPQGSEQMTIAQIICGTAAILGHVFPAFAGFRGGKGVATTFGVLLALYPLLTVSCTGVFLAVLLLSGYVSLASMTAGVAFPVLLMTAFHTPSLTFRIFAIVIALALIITHKKNISRLLKGEEKKFIKKKKKD